MFGWTNEPSQTKKKEEKREDYVIFKPIIKA